MIPQFPAFKNLEISDKEEIEAITQKFPPYSDFNFVSLWSWDVHGNVKVSILNNNLVVKFSNYLTGESFFSFIGKSNVDETIKTLLAAAKEDPTVKNELDLIPEDTVKLITDPSIIAKEEPDHFDYIYDLKYLAEFAGGHFASKRTAINKLERNYPNIRVDFLDIHDNETKIQIKKINNIWINNKSDKKDAYSEVKNELFAVDRFLISPIHNNILTVGVFIDNTLVAYNLVEKIDALYTMCHFVKADLQYPGIYDYLMRELSVRLCQFGYKFINFEQDLGLPGLKKSKVKFSTGIYFKKYKIVV